jgi:hypothetical protein
MDQLKEMDMKLKWMFVWTRGYTENTKIKIWHPSEYSYVRNYEGVWRVWQSSRHF